MPDFISPGFLAPRWTTRPGISKLRTLSRETLLHLSMALKSNPLRNRMQFTNASERMIVRAYQPADEAAVVDLWRRCGLLRPQNDPRKDIQYEPRISQMV
jgi:hypothetical protein